MVGLSNRCRVLVIFTLDSVFTTHKYNLYLSSGIMVISAFRDLGLSELGLFGGDLGLFCGDLGPVLW